MDRFPLIHRESLGPADAIHNRFNTRLYDPKLYDPSLVASKSLRDSLASSKSNITLESLESPESLRSSIASYNSNGSNVSTFSDSYNFRASMSSRSSVVPQKLLPQQTKPLPPIFKRLPQEVYDCILYQLRIAHSDPLSPSCATCYLRDLYNLALANRAWDKAVRAQLYDTIWIVGNDSPAQLKKFRLKYGTRLKLLRRTLRERRVLAQYVRELKVPDLLGKLDPGSREGTEYINLVASMVMACPNLQRLVGFYPNYDHEFDRLRHALSTRKKLKEHVWIVGNETNIRGNTRNPSIPSRPLQRDYAFAFLQYHDMWNSLDTLFLHSEKTGIISHEVFVGVFRWLPSLKHLFVSDFDASDFGDLTLQALPALHSLRLQGVRGVTDHGLSRMASIPALQFSLRSLSLINLEISSLPVVSKLLTNLADLRRFTLVQESSPELPLGGWAMQPVVASSTAEFIHWDVLIPGSANENLAKSIAAGGFPRLRKLRAPSDHKGLLQNVCMPRAQIELPSDKYSFSQRQAVSANQDRYLRTLFAARKAAQERIEEARNKVHFKVMVEEDGILQEEFEINGFMGSIGSKILYSLAPDVHGSDNAVVDIPDIIDSNKETNVKDGCTGMWNAHHHAGKKWWSHTERYRYRPTDLQRFF